MATNPNLPLPPELLRRRLRRIILSAYYAEGRVPPSTLREGVEGISSVALDAGGHLRYGLRAWPEWDTHAPSHYLRVRRRIRAAAAKRIDRRIRDAYERPPDPEAEVLWEVTY